MVEDVTYRPSRFDQPTLEDYSRLFAQCFPKARIGDLSYLDWLYRKNPHGEAVGFDALAGGIPVATYVCIPLALSLGGAGIKALLSLNTATAPAYQGRGLFTKLADMTYLRARKEGFSAVVGVANQNSVGGFTRKLGFQDVAGLDARISPGPRRGRDATAETSAEMRRVWSAEALRWRAANPLNPLRFHRAAHGALVAQGATQFPALPVNAALLAADLDAPVLRRPNWPLPSLSLGLIPNGFAAPSLSFPIPERLKPSPLRLIFKSLDDPVRRLDPGRVFWTFLDFDAY